jgi:hypothetical protein
MRDLTIQEKEIFGLQAICLNAGIHLEYQFVGAGESGIAHDARWGYQIKGSKAVGPLKFRIDPLKCANVMRDAFIASGFGDKESVACNAKGCWVDGEMVHCFLKSYTRPYEQGSTEAKPLLDDLKPRFHDMTPEIAHDAIIDTSGCDVIYADINMPAPKKFIESLRQASLFMGRGKK